jgi:hypothetical protein
MRLAARATGRAAGAWSVSFNVAAFLSKTVISPANQELCFISVRLAQALRARPGAKREDES